MIAVLQAALQLVWGAAGDLLTCLSMAENSRAAPHPALDPAPHHRLCTPPTDAAQQGCRHTAHSPLATMAAATQGQVLHKAEQPTMHTNLHSLVLDPPRVEAHLLEQKRQSIGTDRQQRHTQATWRGPQPGPARHHSRSMAVNSER